MLLYVMRPVHLEFIYVSRPVITQGCRTSKYKYNTVQ